MNTHSWRQPLGKLLLIVLVIVSWLLFFPFPSVSTTNPGTVASSGETALAKMQPTLSVLDAAR